MGRLISLPSAVIFNMLLARVLTPDEYGVIGIITQLISFLLIISLFGYDKILLKFLPDFFRKNKFKEFYNLLFQSLLISISLALFFAIILNTFSSNISNLYANNNFEIAIPIFSICLILQIFNLNLVSVLISIKKVWQANISDRTIMNLFYLLVLFLLISLGFEISLVDASYIFLFGKVISCIFLLISSNSFLKKINLNSFKFKFLNHTKTASYFMSSDMTLRILAASSPLIIGLFLSTDQVAFYYTGFILANLTSFLISMVNNLVSNKISILYADNQYKSILSLNLNVVKFLLSFSLLVLIIYIFFGEFILSFWGDEYVKYSYLVLIILTIGELINSIGGSTGLIISICDLEKKGFYITIIGALINILLQFILIQTYGLIGAALATSVSVISYNIMKYYIVLEKLKKY